MAYANQAFADRTRRITRRRESMAMRGVSHRMGKDGLIEARPRRRLLPRFPLAAVVLLIGATLLFKGFLLHSLGEDDYAARLDALSTGTTVDRAGAMLMQVDPATRGLSDLLSRVTG